MDNESIAFPWRKEKSLTVQRLDIVIDGATVVDGSGKERYQADIGIKGDQISAVGRLREADAKRRVHAEGKILCPGFIDVHSHADLSLHLPDQFQLLEPLVRQGITTVVGGNCGMALAPLAGKNDDAIMAFYRAFTGKDQSKLITWRSFEGYMDALEKRGLLLNAGLLAPHGILRLNEMGQAKRLATEDELEGMKVLLRDCLEAGALGLSTGLQYFPGSQSDTEELVALAELLKPGEAVFTSHLRSYSNTLDKAIEEVKRVVREAEVHGQISHLFCVPHVNDRVDALVRRAARMGSWIYRRIKFPFPLDFDMARVLRKLDKEIEEGLHLGIDVMPTAAGFTHLLAFFPPWVLEDDLASILARIQDHGTRKRILDDIENGQSVWPHTDDRTWSMNFLKLMGWDGVYIMSVVSEKNKALEGMNLKELSRLHKKHPFDVACDLLLEENGQVLVFETFTRPGDDFLERSLYAAMRNPYVSIVTDTILLGYGRPAHLFYDCYPKYLSKYARDLKLVSLEQGVRKCTSLPASQLGIQKRGRVEEGCYADLVLLDLDALGTTSTFEKPDVFPTGIEMVLINGRPVLEEGTFSPEPVSGRLLRRQNQ